MVRPVIILVLRPARRRLQDRLHDLRSGCARWQRRPVWTCPRVNSTRASAGWKSSGLSPEGFLRAQCRPIWRHCGGSANRHRRGGTADAVLARLQQGIGQQVPLWVGDLSAVCSHCDPGHRNVDRTCAYAAPKGRGLACTYDTRRARGPRNGLGNKQAPGLRPRGFQIGAGDENRTRALSLGSDGACVEVGPLPGKIRCQAAGVRDWLHRC